MKSTLLCTYLACILLVSAFKTNAQNHDWSIQFGDIGIDYISSMALDSNGNILATGYFTNTVDFDPGPGIHNISATANCQAMFVVKLDANGNLLWVNTAIGSSFLNYGYSVTNDPLGNVYVTGIFSGTADFDPGTGVFNLSSGAGGDIFVWKLDYDGNLIWVKSMGGAYDAKGVSIAVDDSSNVYTMGEFFNYVDFDPDTAVIYYMSSTYGKVFISKLDSSGNFVWAKQIAGNTGHAHTVKYNNGFLLLTGTFGNTSDFDPGPGTYNMTAPGVVASFIVKFDTNASLIWAKKIQCNSNDICSVDIVPYMMTYDNNDNIIIVGMFRGMFDFDPDTSVFSLTSSGALDIFLLKLDNNGGLVWAKSMGSADQDAALSVTTDALNRIYVTGYYRDTIDIDPGPGTHTFIANTQDEVFQCIFDPAGNLLWAKSLGDTMKQMGIVVLIDNTGNIYWAGTFEGNVDFNPPFSSYLTSNGMRDIFITKYSAFNVSTSDVSFIGNSQPTLFPNPGNGNYTIRFESNQPEILVTVSNLMGQIIGNYSVKESTVMEVDFVGPSGMYNVSVATPYQISNFKVILQ